MKKTKYIFFLIIIFFNFIQSSETTRLLNNENQSSNSRNLCFQLLDKIIPCHHFCLCFILCGFSLFKEKNEDWQCRCWNFEDGFDQFSVSI